MSALQSETPLQSATFALQDARCAGCVLKIERQISALPGVTFARGNATQKRLRLAWQEGQQSAESLIRAIQDLGYNALPLSLEADAPKQASLLPRLAAAAIGTMNIMALSFSVWAGLVTDMGAGTVQYMHILSGLIALPVVLYSGAVFYRPALRALMAAKMTMDTPITLAIVITFAASVFETIRGSEHVYFDAVVSLIFFLLIGRVLEQSLQKRSGDAAGNLRELMQVPARVLQPDGQLLEVSVDDLKVGDQLSILTGERVPADGILQSPLAELDESVITGEVLPRRLNAGDMMPAGAILVAGPATLRVTHVGADAQIGQLAQMIDDVATHKGQMQKLSDRFAQTYVPLVLGGGALGFLIWYGLLGASFADALMIAVAVLVVTCPCAAGLATPAVTARAVNLLLQMGVVVKSGDALERLGDIDRVIFDKTGTASLPSPVQTTTGDQPLPEEALALAAASRHPLAQILAAGRGIPPIEGAVEHPGQGILAPNGARLGSAEFTGAPLQNQSQPMIWYRAPETGDIHAFAFHEMAREDLDTTLLRLAEMGLSASLLSGDTEGSVARFAQDHGITDWRAGHSPAEKQAHVAQLQTKGARPLMIGDGINDSAALASAHVSASMAGATQVAQVAADIVLTQDRLARIPDAIALARQSRRLIVQNLSFSTLYNIVSVPLALAGLLSPLIAALLMSSSSVIVLANGLRLRSRA